MRITYHKLSIKTSETFATFRTTFLRLADGAAISLSERKEDIYRKLEPSLRLQLTPILADLTTLPFFITRIYTIYQNIEHIKD